MDFVFQNPKIRLSIISVMAVSIIVAIGWLISVSLFAAFIAILVLLALGAVPFFIKNNQYLFYLFMLTFVFGNIGSQFVSFLPKFSVSNLLLIYALIIMVLNLDNTVYSLFSTRRRKTILIMLILSLLITFVSGIINGSLRYLITKTGDLLTVVLVFSTVRNYKILLRGLTLGVLSVGYLGLLTLLTSAGLLNWGYRVSWNSHLAPWESVLPRAVGLPQMDGGYHGVFILSLLPLAYIFFAKRKYFGKKNVLIYLVSVLLSLIGLAVALFRSAWIALAVVAVFYALYSLQHENNNKKRIILILIIVVITLVGLYLIFINWQTTLSEIDSFFFQVRARGVDVRLSQYHYVWTRTIESPANLLFGFGHGAFSDEYATTADFLSSGISEKIGLHNHFLGLYFSEGIISLLIYISLFSLGIYRLFRLSRDEMSQLRWIALGLLLGLVADIIVLNFTAVLAGYKIIWVVISIAVILPDISLDDGKKSSVRGNSKFITN